MNKVLKLIGILKKINKNKLLYAFQAIGLSVTLITGLATASPVSPLDIAKRRSGIAVIVHSPLLQNSAKSEKVFLDLHPCEMRKTLKNNKKVTRCFPGTKRFQVPVQIGAIKSPYSRPPVYSIPAGNYFLKQVSWLHKKNGKRFGLNLGWKMQVVDGTILKLGVMNIREGAKKRLKATFSPFPQELVEDNPEWPEFKRAVIPSWLLNSKSPRLRLKRKYVNAYQEDLNSFDANAWNSTEVIEYHMGRKNHEYRSAMVGAPSSLPSPPSPPRYDMRTRVVRRTKPQVSRVAPPPTNRTVNYQIGVQYNVAVTKNRGYTNRLLSSLGSETNALQGCYEHYLKSSAGIVRGSKWSSYVYQFKAAPSGTAAVRPSGNSQPSTAMDHCLQKVLKRAHRRGPPNKLTSGVMKVRFDYNGQ